MCVCVCVCYTVPSETSEEKLKLYEELRAEHPYSKVARVLPLMVATGLLLTVVFFNSFTLFPSLSLSLSLSLPTDDVFTSYLESYLQSELHKGVPSLFIAIKGLYKDPQKVVCYARAHTLERKKKRKGKKKETTFVSQI